MSETTNPVMQEITLKIQVDAGLIETICKDGMNGLPKERLDDVLVDAVKVALGLDKEYPTSYDHRGVLVRNTAPNSMYGRYEPTPLMLKILEKIDYSSHLDKLADTISSYIAENYQSLVQKAIMDVLVSKVFCHDGMRDLQSLMLSHFNDQHAHHR